MKNIKHYYVFYIIIVIALIFSACGNNKKNSNINNETTLIQSNKERDTSLNIETAELNELVNGNTIFAIEFYKTICNQNSNIFFSPYSISVALAMTYAGAKGDTELQIKDTMHFTLSQERLHPAFNFLDLEFAKRGKNAKAQDGKGFRLNIANSIWGQKSYSFLTSFLDVLALNYGAGLQVLDFQNAPEDSRITINNWVKEKTENRIDSVIPEGVITPDTRLVLTNAVYFNAAWLHTFNETSTQESIFYLLDNSQVKVSMMNQAEEFAYTEGENFQAVELPYDGNELSMVILLPQSGKFIEFENIFNSEKLDIIIDNLENREITLKLPRFIYKSESVSLKNTLSSMGMPVAFSSAANFSGMDGTMSLSISDVVHQAFISVNEAGTEAAASTGVVTWAGIPETEVNINRPFIFLIRDIKTKAILFFGRIINPAE
ncbi:MAG: serpin family protein [Candidatus Firestonebacteria bacterium]|nr:serpin family protein [Candidatus Firestonebacteria bacterium]